MMRHNIEILTPTLLEYWAVRCVLPSTRARRVGIRLARWNGAPQGSIVVVCGLAGSLAPDLAPGTVLIPDRVGLADGTFMSCDPTLVRLLVAAARRLHFQPETGPLLTSRSLIVGEDRQAWFQRGFVAADMETGLLAGHNLRVATIRIVLDGPAHDISPDWMRPTGAWLQPRIWRELPWLGLMAPRYALRAAQVLKAGLASEPACTIVE